MPIFLPLDLEPDYVLPEGVEHRADLGPKLRQVAVSNLISRFFKTHVSTFKRVPFSGPVSPTWLVRRLKGPGAAASGGKRSLRLAKSEFLQLDSLSDNSFDPFIDTSLAVEPGQECGTRGQFARNRKGCSLGLLNSDGRLPSGVNIRLGNDDSIDCIPIQGRCSLLVP